MLDWSGLVGALGPLSMSVMFVVLALLSQRLGRVTRVRPYYLGLYLAALLLAVSTLARVVNLGRGADAAHDLGQDTLLVFLYTVAPALGVTIGLIVAWRYWSWLFAERD